MSFLSKMFTWWNGSSVGTDIFTRRHGEKVGSDHLGNTYFRHRKAPARRWYLPPWHWGSSTGCSPSPPSAR